MRVFDLETDGLLDIVSVIHCINIWSEETGERLRYNDHGYKAAGTIAEGVAILGASDELLAHFGLGYDFLVLDKLYPGWDAVGKPKRYDSIVMSALIWTELKKIDFTAKAKGGWAINGGWSECPEKMGGIIGSHSLAAWGHRLGEHKGEYRPDEGHDTKWISWNEEMDDYCDQDVVVTVKLWEMIKAKGYSQIAIDLEHAFAAIIHRQCNHGWAFNEAAADRLVHTLSLRKAELEEELHKEFRPWLKRDRCKGDDGYRCPKVKNGPRNESAGAAFDRVKTVIFNPGSNDHIADRLQKLYGWVPEDYGKDGKPTLDDDHLKVLPYECIPLIRDYKTVTKRLGMLSTGKGAVLKYVKNGRVHGRVQSNGAGTGRCTHSQPNVAQTPASGKPYGAEFRALYYVPKGYKLVGADGSGLELRIMSHYMANYDGGAYAKEVVSGDAHWVNLRAIGVANCDRDKNNKAHKEARDAGKTWVYAFLYGCGVPVSGSNYYDTYLAFHGKPPKGTLNAMGSRSRAALKKNIPALAKLEKRVKAKAKAEGRLRALDGRFINIRSIHSALNALFQSGGAIVMKKALCILDTDLQEAGLVPGVDYEHVGNIHDEFQIEVRDVGSNVKIVAELAEAAMVKAGEFFNMNVLIEGEAQIGDNWSETH